MTSHHLADRGELKLCGSCLAKKVIEERSTNLKTVVAKFMCRTGREFRMKRTFSGFFVSTLYSISSEKPAASVVGTEYAELAN